MSNNDRTTLERLIRIGWDALENTRREQLSLEKFTQNARDALETARRGLMDETALKTFEFKAPMDNASTANIELELSVGESHLYALAQSDNQLLASQLNYLGALSFGVSGDVARYVYLRQATPLTVGWVNPINWANRPNWDIGLSPRVPLDLRVQGGVGAADINLTDLTLQSLRVDGNIGPMNITLGTSDIPYPGNIRGAAGPIALNIPNRANANLKLRGGFGGLFITIAADAAVQLNVAGGVGKTVMNPGFRRIEATAPVLPNTGTWETANYHTSTRRVTLTLADGMVGNVSVRVLQS